MNLVTVSTSQSIKDFLSQYSLKQGFKSSDFLSLNINQDKKDLSTMENLPVLTNRQVITSSWVNSEDLKNNVASQSDDSIVIKEGTQVGLPNDSLFRDQVLEFPDQVIPSHSKGFISSILKQLFEDPDYQQKIISDNKFVARKDIHSGVSVYIWPRSGYTKNGVGTTSWIDVSKDINDIRTSVTGQMGSFTFSLPTVRGSYSNDIWQKDRLIGYFEGEIEGEDGGQISFLNSKTSISHENIDRENNNVLLRTIQYYSTILQENDLVYIRFETLNNENKRPIGDLSTKIAGYTYDMIGFIDTVSTTTTNGSVQTVVTGRDLTKVLIEDGSIFFPEQLATNIFNDKDSILAKRNIMSGVESSLLNYSYSFKSIELILKFIFNKFSNIGYIPTDSDILTSYGEKALEKKYELKTSNLKNTNGQILEQLDKVFLSKQKREGIWRIIDFIFDPSISDRVLADNSIAMDNGSIINSIQKICQQPFVEFFGDTYGDRYVFTARKPPFDFEGYNSLVYGNCEFDKRVDGFISAKDISKAEHALGLNKKNLTEPKSRQAYPSDLVIEIDEVDIISDSFTYHDEAYSWYRLIPRGLGVISDLASFQLAPVVSFDEYALVWGNKTYSVEDNYCPSAYLDDTKNSQRVGYAESQAFYDLQYLIQSNAYLPFTRRGSMVLTGNRLIKRGYFIYYKPTREIFYVDSVTQVKDANNRQTILQVSRGMREPFIKGLEIDIIVNNEKKKKKISYFSIINTEIDTTASINNNDFLKNWKVDKDIFDFFIQRRQWDENLIL